MTDELNRIKKLAGLSTQKITLNESTDATKGEYYADNEGDDWYIFHTDKGQGKAFASAISKQAAMKKADEMNNDISEKTDTMRDIMDVMSEWANSSDSKVDDRGRVMDMPNGDNVSTSLRDYLNADPMKVKIEEDVSSADLLEKYNAFKSGTRKNIGYTARVNGVGDLDEEKLDELSPATMQSYINKASIEDSSIEKNRSMGMADAATKIRKKLNKNDKNY